MVKLIIPNQSSFIPGRDITDNIIVAQEVVHFLKNFRYSKLGMVLKIDLEKAYDKISWEFLQDTLLEARITQGLVRVIMNCASTASFKVLWNRATTKAFQSSCGIR